MPEIDVNRYCPFRETHCEIWGWEIAMYLFLGGLVAGLMVFSSILNRRDGDDEPSRWIRWMPFAVPILISAGMFLLFLDLENKKNVLRFYLAFMPRSPMSWGAWILVLLYPAALLLGFASLTDSEAEKLRSWSPLRAFRLGGLVLWLRSWGLERKDALRQINIWLGVALGLYTGILLGTLEAKALWNSAILAPLFLASGVSTGAAFLMLFPLRRGEHRSLVRWDLYAIGAEVILIGLFILDRATGCILGKAQAARFLGGDLTSVFWSVVVIAGLGVPLLLEALEIRKSLRPTVAAPILIIIGGITLRWLLVHAGQTPVPGI